MTQINLLAKQTNLSAKDRARILITNEIEGLKTKQAPITENELSYIAGSNWIPSSKYAEQEFDKYYQVIEMERNLRVEILANYHCRTAFIWKASKYIDMLTLSKDLRKVYTPYNQEWLNYIFKHSKFSNNIEDPTQFTYPLKIAEVYFNLLNLEIEEFYCELLGYKELYSKLSKILDVDYLSIINKILNDYSDVVEEINREIGFLVDQVQMDIIVAFPNNYLLLDFEEKIFKLKNETVKSEIYFSFEKSFIKLLRYDWNYY